MLTFTPAAVEAARKAIAAADAPFIGVRVIVEGGGCSGDNFQLGMEDTLEEDDTQLEFDGLKVIVDSESLPQTEGVTVDFRDDEEGARFIVSGGKPRKSGGGGCGCSCGGGGHGGHGHDHGHGGHHH